MPTLFHAVFRAPMIANNYGASDRLRTMVPILFSIAVLMMLATPVFAGLTAVPACWALLVFFWRIYCPAAYGYGWVFFTGILTDYLLNVPLGVHALTAITGALLLEPLARRIMRQPFRLIWVAAACITAIMLLLSAALAMATGHSVTLRLLMHQWVITALCYPLWHLILSVVLRLLPPPVLRA